MIIENNILKDHIRKGLKYRIVFESVLDLTVFDEVKADFKATPELDAPAVFSLEVGTGIYLTVLGGIIELTASQTESISQKVLYMDLKAKNTGEDPKLLFTAKITVLETVTNVQL